MIKKFFFALFLFIGFQASMYGCALCALSIPSVHVTVDFGVQNKTLENIHMTWTFSEKFSQDLLYGYDENGNKKIDKDELEEIESILIDYITPKEYLVEAFFYDKPDGETQRLPVKPKNIKMKLENSLIVFTFDLPQNMLIFDKRVVKMQVIDDEGFFNFRFLDQSEYLGKYKIVSNINLDTAFFEFDKEVVIQTFTKKPMQKVAQTDQLVAINTTAQTTYTQFLIAKLNQYTNVIKELFIKSKESPSALFSLIALSFLYGFFHAAGPGHGKTLVGSYFAGSGGGYVKALLLSLKIGVIHVAGAFLLVLVSVYGIKTFISKLLIDVTWYTTVLSAVIIITIGLYLLLKKIVESKTGHHHSCQCCACTSREHHSKKEEWGIALGAGLVPCPGTVVIFILAFTLGNYISGFLSAAAMAFGMSTVIFFASMLGNFLHEKTSKSFEKLVLIFEYVAIIVLLVLGIMLLFSAF